MQSVGDIGGYCRLPREYNRAMGRALATYMLLAGVAFAAQAGKLPGRVAKNAKAAHEAANGKKKVVEPPPQAVPTPAQPVVPLRPSQMPSVAPRVSYQNGALTVVAENSTIADILSAIHAATGIRIEAQGGPSGDRVAAKIGPAAPREVLLSLLQGSRFDYVMLGSATDPEKIERVILTPKIGAGGTAQQATNTPLRPTVPQLPGDQVNDEGDPNQPDYEDPGAPPLRGDDNQNAQPPDEQAPQQEQQPVGPQPPQAPPQNSTNPNAQPQNSTNPNPPLNQNEPQAQQSPRTPEQMLQDVRRMQQHQQAIERARPK